MLRAFLAFSALSLSATAYAQQENAAIENVQQHYFEVSVLPISEQIFVEKFDLGSVVDGQTQKVTVRLKNLTSKPIELKTVSDSCSCTKAQVPSKTIKPNDFEVAEFTFPIEDTRQHLESHISATINCEGAVQRILLGFDAKVTSVARFAVSPATFTISDDNGYADASVANQAMFDIPLLIDDDSIVSKIKIESRGELDVKLISISKQNDRYVAKIQIDTALVSPAGSNGELVLTSPYGQDMIVCSILRESLVTVLPQTITFVTDAEKKDKWTAFAVARVRQEKSVTNQLVQDKVRNVSVGTLEDDSPSIQVEAVEMNKGTYRLNFLSERKPGKAYKLPSNIRIKVETERGNFPLDLVVRWAN